MTFQPQLAETQRLPATSAEEPNMVRHAVRVAFARRWTIAGVFGVVLAAAAAWMLQATPLYTASVTVLLADREQKVVDFAAVLNGLQADPATIENQVQIIRSRAMAEAVVVKLGLQNDPEFNPHAAGAGGALLSGLAEFAGQAAGGLAQLVTGAPPEGVGQAPESAETREMTAVVDRYLEKLSAAPRGRSSLIAVAITTADPQKSARIANAHADAYVQEQVQAKFDAQRQATVWLTQQVEELAAQLKADEQAVERFKAEHAMTDLSEGTLLERQLSDLNAQLADARTKRAQAEAQLAQMQGARDSGAILGVLQSPVVGQLRAQEADLSRKGAELLERYGEKHPSVVNVRAEQRSVRARIGDEIGRIVASMQNEVVVARAAEEEAVRRMAELEAQTVDQRRQMVPLRELERNAASTRNLYEAMLARLKETQGTGDLQTADARILSRAVAPLEPSFPKKLNVMAIAFVLALGLSAGLVTTLERLDNGFRTALQAEQTLGFVTLATVPELPQSRSAQPDAAARVIDKPLSAFTEAIRGLQSGLMLSDVDNPPRVVMVTSAVPSEGKTTLAISLARLAAKSGQRVLLIDADLRRPNVARTMGLAKLTGGLLETLASGGTMSGNTIADPRSPLTVLPIHRKPASPPDVAGSGAMIGLLRSVRQDYDLVVIDAAPILPVHDSKILARHADRVLFAVRWEKTPREAAQTALKDLTEAGGKVAGVVLTRADESRNLIYSYGYGEYRKYAEYYAD